MGPNSAIENVCIDGGWGGAGMATWPRGDAGQVGHGSELDTTEEFD